MSFYVGHFLRYKITPILKCVSARTNYHLQTHVNLFKITTTEARGLA